MTQAYLKRNALFFKKINHKCICTDVDKSNVLRKIELKTMPLSKCNATFLEYNIEAHRAVFKYGVYEGQVNIK